MNNILILIYNNNIIISGLIICWYGKQGLSGTSNCALLAAEDGWYWLVYCQLDTAQNPQEESGWPVAGVEGWGYHL